MCTNGSNAARSTPAKARRTGNPSPSNPVGAVVTDSTARWTASGAIEGSLGRATVSAVTAGIGTSRWIVAHATYLSANTTQNEFVPARVEEADKGTEAPTEGGRCLTAILR